MVKILKKWQYTPTTKVPTNRSTPNNALPPFTSGIAQQDTIRSGRRCVKRQVQHWIGTEHVVIPHKDWRMAKKNKNNPCQNKKKGSKTTKLPQKKNNLKSNHVAMNHCQKNVNVPMLPAMFLVCPSGTNTHVCGTTSTEKVKPVEKKSKIFRAIPAIVYQVPVHGTPIHNRRNTYTS